jgi:hypothetical protein
MHLATRYLRSVVLVILSALASLAAARADEYDFAQTFSETHPLAASGEVTLSNVNGTVTIRTWDRNEVRIQSEKRAKTREELDLIELVIDAQPSRLAIKAILPKRPGGWFGGSNVRGAVTFTLTVPATARLRDIGTTNGAIDIADVRGSVNAHSVNGRITARGLAGDTTLETVNGAIAADFAPLVAGQKISTRTVNGSSTVSLPKAASFSFRANTVNGSIDCAFPLTIEGSVKRNRVHGTVGSGAASFEAETVNGSIRVKQL